MRRLSFVDALQGQRPRGSGTGVEMVSLTDGDRELARVGLRSLTQGLVRLKRLPVAPGSLASDIMLQANADLSSGETLGTMTLSGVAIKIASLCEHVDVFVRGVESQQMTVTLATITRSALECAANIDYVVCGKTADNVLQRQLQLAIEELKYPVRHSQFRTAAGQAIDGQEWLSELQQLLVGLGQIEPDDRLPGMAARVSNLLSKRGPVDPGIYSQLSGVAHGGSTSIGMFLNPRTGRLALPREIAAEYVGYLFVAAWLIGDRFAEIFGTKGADLRRWEASRDRSLRAISAFRTSVYPDD